MRKFEANGLDVVMAVLAMTERPELTGPMTLGTCAITACAGCSTGQSSDQLPFEFGKTAKLQQHATMRGGGVGPSIDERFERGTLLGHGVESI